MTPALGITVFYYEPQPDETVVTRAAMITELLTATLMTLLIFSGASIYAVNAEFSEVPAPRHWSFV